MISQPYTLCFWFRFFICFKTVFLASPKSTQRLRDVVEEETVCSNTILDYSTEFLLVAIYRSSIDKMIMQIKWVFSSIKIITRLNFISSYFFAHNLSTTTDLNSEHIHYAFNMLFCALLYHGNHWCISFILTTFFFYNSFFGGGGEGVFACFPTALKIYLLLKHAVPRTIENSEPIRLLYNI